MKRNTILTAAALFAAALFILDVPAANATPKYFDDYTNDHKWSTDGNWSTSSSSHVTTTKPVDGDDAVILTGKHCDVDITTARADSFAVEGSGVLDINTGQQLEIDSASSVVGSAGVIIVGTGTLKISASLTISGAGSIDCQSDTAAIEIAASTTLTITTTIEGNGQIREPALGAASTAFVNHGNVKANNASGTLELSVDSLNTAAPAGPSGDWEVSASGAFLKFSVGSILMSGDFTISEGTLDVDVSCTTSGDLEVQEGGQVDVVANETFTACSS